jgi:hypothetical protein
VGGTSRRLLGRVVDAASRTFDVAVAAAVPVVALPVLAAVAVPVRLTMRWPVLFRQGRAGRGGEKTRDEQLDLASDFRREGISHEGDATRPERPCSTIDGAETRAMDVSGGQVAGLGTSSPQPRRPQRPLLGALMMIEPEVGARSPTRQ